MNASQTSIDLCVYYFTFHRLADKLLNLNRQREIKIRIIVHESCLDQFPQQLIEAKIPVIVKMGSIMHHKFMVVDGVILTTGSFNWTKAAVSENEENLMVLDSPTIVKKYYKQFNYLWKKFDHDRIVSHEDFLS